MKKLEATLIKTESWIQEELSAQEKMLALLGQQEQAVIAGDTEGFRSLSEDIEGELSIGLDRSGRRREILEELGEQWNVAPKTLTLRSIATRAGEQGWDTSRLCGLRTRLRERTAEVLKVGRRIAAHARYHRGLLEELVQILMANPEGGEDRPGGVLVDAEA